MKADFHRMPETCPEASSPPQLVQIEVSPTHPLLLLKRALPWEAITEAMTRHWREHGKNVDGGPGLPWDVSFYVPLVVLMLIKHIDSRQMEAYVAENVVARVFIGRYRNVQAQIRDHSNIARAYAALGKAGIEEVTRLVIKEAHRFGFVDEGVLSADTTAQELPIGYPNEPGILRGLAQRCGRALMQLHKRGVQGLDRALEQVQTIVRSVKEHHLFSKGREEKRAILTRILTEVGALMVHTRPLIEGLETRADRVVQSARSRLAAMHGVIKPLMRQMVQWLTTGKVAANKIIHVGIQPKGHRPWSVAEAVRDQIRTERGQTEGVIGTLKSNRYKFNKPKERLWHTLEMAGPRSILSFNLNKFMRDLVELTK